MIAEPENVVEAHIRKALEGLKDFQAATVDVVHKRMFQGEQRHMLIADEVGLGKTIVAKGVIARELLARQKAGDDRPFKVTYICSNQVIAGENIQKLNLFSEGAIIEKESRRLVFLAYQLPRKRGVFANSLTLNTLTPGTSFQSTHYPGTRPERAILYALLCHDSWFADRKEGLACLARGHVDQEAEAWGKWLEKERTRKLRPDLPERFLTALGSRVLDSKCKEAYKYLGTDKEVTLLEVAMMFADRLAPENQRVLQKARNQVIGALRKLLIDLCVDYVNADLFILDEFQRFRSLIDSESDAEETKIAMRIFGQRQARVLLLSATPFKAFTGDLDQANGEDHFKDFGMVLRFLTGENDADLKKYDIHRGALYRQLLNLQPGNQVSTEHREAIEDILRKVMCRTERHSVATDPNAMILDRWRTEHLPFDTRDIENFTAADHLAQVIARAYQKGRHAIGTPVEYCKSSPFPFSYLDGYVLKEVLKKLKNQSGVRKALKSHRDAWLDTSKIDNYQLVVGSQNEDSPTVCSHARLSQLIDAAVGTQGAGLLWIPPSMPYYPLRGAFAEAEGFSKTLVFSAWVMVPRMISTLVSYEVERRTIGNPKTKGEQEKTSRVYFKEKNRHPDQQFTFPPKSAKSQSQHITNFCILYPSPTVASIITIQELLSSNKGLDELRHELAERFREIIRQANLKRFENPDGTSERWNWAAPLLLDRDHPETRQILDSWFSDDRAESAKKYFFGKNEKRGRVEHFQTLQQAFNAPEEIGLGMIPDRLPEVLADMALGSPAVTALRSLTTLYDVKKVTAGDLNDALRIAGEFLSLYNKPESITAIRLTPSDYPYWRHTLRYGGEGCIQAMLDEYLHLLKEQCNDRKEVVGRLSATINISTASINVDGYDSFMAGKAMKMRCHYAVEFGNQKIETEDGEKRASSIRANFNSPFRPFVLATTSIGQEGLDFHQYCRRIVHWNLPGNPIDLEQREGRINRYKGLVIRQQLARKYAKLLLSEGVGSDPWESLFQLADQHERLNKGECELIPFWHVNTDTVQIERLVPMYPFSKDASRLDHILKTLAIYRLAFGQPRQVELVEHLLSKDLTDHDIEEVRKSLMVNLSPIAYLEAK